MERLNIIKRLFDTGTQCEFCNKEIRPGSRACPKCHNALELLKTSLAPERCAYKYDGVLKALIHSIKYDDCRYKCVYAAELMYDAWKNTYDIKIDLLTYVPVHKSREKKRGFDQSRVICESLAEFFNLPCQRLFERVKQTKPQYKLNAAQRKANLQDAFLLVKSPAPEVKTVMIIDDIYTTGVTMRECAKLLPPEITAVPYTLCYDEPK